MTDKKSDTEQTNNVARRGPLTPQSNMKQRAYVFNTASAAASTTASSTSSDSAPASSPHSIRHLPSTTSSGADRTADRNRAPRSSQRPHTIRALPTNESAPVPPPVSTPLMPGMSILHLLHPTMAAASTTNAGSTTSQAAATLSAPTSAPPPRSHPPGFAPKPTAPSRLTYTKHALLEIGYATIHTAGAMDVAEFNILPELIRPASSSLELPAQSEFSSLSHTVHSTFDCTAVASKEAHARGQRGNERPERGKNERDRDRDRDRDRGDRGDRGDRDRHDRRDRDRGGDRSERGERRDKELIRDSMRDGRGDRYSEDQTPEWAVDDKSKDDDTFGVGSGGFTFGQALDRDADRKLLERMGLSMFTPTNEQGGDEVDQTPLSLDALEDIDAELERRSAREAARKKAKAEKQAGGVGGGETIPEEPEPVHNPFTSDFDEQVANTRFSEVEAKAKAQAAAEESAPAASRSRFGFALQEESASASGVWGEDSASFQWSDAAQQQRAQQWHQTANTTQAVQTAPPAAEPQAQMHKVEVNQLFNMFQGQQNLPALPQMSASSQPDASPSPLPAAAPAGDVGGADHLQRLVNRTRNRKATTTSTQQLLQSAQNIPINPLLMHSQTHGNAPSGAPPGYPAGAQVHTQPTAGVPPHVQQQYAAQQQAYARANLTPQQLMLMNRSAVAQQPHASTAAPPTSAPSHTSQMYSQSQMAYMQHQQHMLQSMQHAPPPPHSLIPPGFQTSTNPNISQWFSQLQQAQGTQLPAMPTTAVQYEQLQQHHASQAHAHHAQQAHHYPPGQH